MRSREAVLGAGTQGRVCRASLRAPAPPCTLQLCFCCCPLPTPRLSGGAHAGCQSCTPFCGRTWFCTPRTSVGPFRGRFWGGSHSPCGGVAPARLSLAALGERGRAGETHGLLAASGTDPATSAAVPGERRCWIQVLAVDPWQSTPAAVPFPLDLGAPG